MKIYADQSIHKTDPVEFGMRCHSCGKEGTFELKVNQVSDLLIGDSNGDRFRVGHRICPNRDCLAHVFIVVDRNGNMVASYPPELIDFNSKHVPEAVSEALEEALTCHAHGCHKAAAMMVRKTLEELCRDQNIEGKNLKARVSKLKDSSIVPQDLMNGVDAIRLLGNDAVHVDAKTFDAIGEEELEVSIEFTKELLKAVYQYEDLVNQLEALKLKAAPGSL